MSRAAGKSTATVHVTRMESAGADSGTAAATDEPTTDEYNPSEEASATALVKAQLDSWKQRKRGLQQLPFAVQNSTSIAAVVAVFEAAAGTFLECIDVSEGMALQIRQLVFSGAVPQLNGGWRCVYALLASFKLGRRAGSPTSGELDRLRQAFDRKVSATSQTAPGLSVAFSLKVASRHQDQEMRGMSLEAARSHLLMRWDRFNFDFDFKFAAAGSGGGSGSACAESLGGRACASGGGGGDPGGSGGGTQQVARRHHGGVALPTTGWMDIRTRTLAAQCELAAVASRQRLQQLAAGRPLRLTQWHRTSGEFPIDVLGLINNRVAAEPLSAARRAETFELQALP